MSRRRGVRGHVGGEHVGFSFPIGCGLPTLIILLLIGLGVYYAVKP